MLGNWVFNQFYAFLAFIFSLFISSVAKSHDFASSSRHSVIYILFSQGSFMLFLHDFFQSPDH